MRVLHAADSLKQSEPTTPWSRPIHLSHGHKLAFGILAAAIISTIAFTGYAYAIGSDPISLINGLAFRTKSEMQRPKMALSMLVCRRACIRQTPTNTRFLPP